MIPHFDRINQWHASQFAYLIDKLKSFRDGEETLFDRNGSSYVSREDFAVAVVDMAENHAIAGRRVAVGPPY